MGHIRLGTLSQSKKWREVIELLGSYASLEDIAEASARAAELDLARASSDPSFKFISRLLVELPLKARSPGFYASLEEMGFASNATESVPKLLSEINSVIDRNAFDLGQSSDIGALAQSALLETISSKLRDGFPSQRHCSSGHGDICQRSASWSWFSNVIANTS